MTTHLRGNDKEGQYISFGLRLAALRQKAGIPSQSALAALLGCKQQTVNRWEVGLSRPRDKQIPLLASILQTDVDQLMIAAGYGAPKTAVVSFDQPFPTDGLAPETFERFCLYLLERLNPDAEVHRVGGIGHAQDGLDIEVVFPDKIRHGFQCKRVDEFGPQKVHATVAKHTGNAKKKFLLLTRVASPQAREAIRQHPTWDIWDKEDISLRIRQLPKDEQRRLVDIFFPKQRQALLGDTESSPWQSAEEFFAPFAGRQATFRHTWPLVGRVEEIRKLVDALSNELIRVVMLIGSGGAGKSRILKEAIEKYASSHKATTVRFISPTEEAARNNLEALGPSNKILVIDDAHDRTDLPLLFQYAARPSNKAKLLLSFRPYGLDYIKSQAGNFALAGDSTLEVKLPPLTSAQSIELAKQVLEEFGGPMEAAADLARLTLDCPLATVIGAQVIAKDRRHVELVKNEEAFRTTILGRFRDIIAGGIGSKSDADLIQKLLRVLALVQPFHPEDESIPRLVEAVEGLSQYDTSRLIRSLTEAGVLFKRGGQFRLSPDLLADHIIEVASIGEGGASTKYAERVFDASTDAQVEHLLLNLGKLDWRLSNRDPSNSRLLDGIWGKLRPSRDYADPYIRAVTSVAYYQPERSLRFAETLIREGRHLRDLPNLIKYAAYSYEHLWWACECLWEVGKNDDRELHQNPGHAIRILSDLCAVEPNKPVEYIEKIVEFGFDLLKRDDVWDYRYSPFDILKGILQPEGHTTTSHGRSFSIGRFSVVLNTVSRLRAKVIDALVHLLTHDNPKIALRAAQCLPEAIRYPMDPPAEALRQWTAEFVGTFAKIETVMQADDVDPLVLIEIAKAVSWHASYADDQTKVSAKRLLNLLPRTLEFRTILALVDGYGRILDRPRDYQQHEKKWNQHLAALTADLLMNCPNGEALRLFVARQLEHIKTYDVRGVASPYVLYSHLVNAAIPLARATVENALAQPDSPTVQFGGMSLAKLLHENRSEGLDYANCFIGSGARNLQILVGTAFGLFDWKDRPLTPQALAILQRVLGSDDEWVARSAAGALRTAAKLDSKLAVELLKCVDVGISSQLADHIFMTFAEDDGQLFSALTGADVDSLLNKLMRLPQLDGHWIEMFLSDLSKSHASRLAQFFIARVNRAADEEDWHYRPCNYGPYGHVPVRFRESPELSGVLRQVSEWIKSRQGLLFRERSAQLFDTMFRPFDDALVEMLQSWSDAATEDDIQAIAKILGEAHPRFVFEQRAFVVRFLERARQFGKDLVDRATGCLFGSAIGGIRSGTPGEPFPEDLRMKEDAGKALVELPRFSPAHELYQAIAQHAETRIEFALREREAFEE